MSFAHRSNWLVKSFSQAGDTNVSFEVRSSLQYSWKQLAIPMTTIKHMGTTKRATKTIGTILHCCVDKRAWVAMKVLEMKAGGQILKRK